MRRVVITGIGAVTPVGNDIETMWDSLVNGKNGIDYIKSFDTEKLKVKVAAEVKDFDPTKYIEKKELRKTDLFCQYAIAAACQAVEDSGIIGTIEDEKLGVYVGSGTGGMHTFFTQCENMIAEKKISPFFIPMMIGNMGAAQIAIKYGARGVNENIVTACASGTNAIGDALRHIQHGANDVIIAGGAEAAVSPLAFAGFCNMKAMSTRNDDPKTASRPFDAERDGFVLSEGAGFIVIEELEHAKKRGAHIYCELVGYGATDDAYHITSPIPGGVGGAKAMSLAIEDAGLKPEDVTYINAHGTSTKYNDEFETQAIKEALGDAAKNVAVSSTKSMTGHLLGAAGGVEAIVCALAIKDSYIPATINYNTPDPACDLDIVPNKGREQEVKVAMSNSLGFGGHNATIVMKKYED